LNTTYGGSWQTGYAENAENINWHKYDNYANCHVGFVGDRNLEVIRVGLDLSSGRGMRTSVA
jgi:hypothetical protein